MAKNTVQIRGASNPTILRTIQEEYPNICTAVETEVNGSLSAFQLHVDTGNTQFYVTFIFTSEVKASVLRRTCASVLPRAGLTIDSMFILDENATPPDSAQLEIDFSL